MSQVAAIAAQPPPRSDRSAAQKATPRRQKMAPPATYMDANTLQAAALSVTRIAKIWRGIRTRRELKARLITEEYRKKKYVHVQCFFRSVKAKRQKAIRRRALDEKLAAISRRYNAERVVAFNERIRWDWKSIEKAATKVQKWFRWLLECKKARAAGKRGHDLPPFPLPTKKKKWLEELTKPAAPRAWAPKPAPSAVPKTWKELEVIPSPPSKTRRKMPTLQDDDASAARAYYTPEEILYLNNAMRDREQQRDQRVKAVRPIREQNNQVAIVRRDLDECASIVQRRFRLIKSTEEVSSRREYANYVRKHAIVIQCAWRSYRGRMILAQKRRIRDAKIRAVTREFNNGQVERVDVESKWNRFTLDRASMVIQRAWRWSKTKKGAKPPYGLLEGTRMKTKRRKQPKSAQDVPAAVEQERQSAAAASSTAEDAASPTSSSPSPASTTPKKATGPPSLDEGRAAVLQVDQKGIRELASYVQPPRMVRSVIEAALTALGDKQAGEWKPAREAIRSDTFIKRLHAVDPAAIAAPDLDKVKRIATAPGFSLAAAERASKAAGRLATWVLAVASL